MADDSGNNAQGKAPVEQPEDPAWLVEDRAWFEAHPDRIFRLRPYVRGELSPTPGAKILEPSAVIDQLKVVADCAAAEDAILSEIRRIGARPATAVLRIDPDGGARMRGLVSVPRGMRYDKVTDETRFLFAGFLAQVESMFGGRI